MVFLKNKKIVLAFVFVCAFSLITAVALSGAEAVPTGKTEENGDVQRKAVRRNILVLGKDSSSGLCDVIMIASLDSTDGELNIIQIPRDTYARYSESGYRKLNGAQKILGSKELCEFLKKSMGIDIDGYLLFDLKSFCDVVDAVGGVEIDLPFDMNYEDPYQDLSIHLNAGKQVLDGKASEMFVRYRSGYLRGDLGRLDAQKLFMSAFIRKVSEIDSAATLTRIVLSVLGDIKTDLDLPTILELMAGAKKIDTGNITMLTLPGEDVRISDRGAWYYVISKKGGAEAVRDHLGGEAGGFDIDGVFTNPKYPRIEKIYSSEIGTTPKSAEEIEKNGIEIQKAS